MKSPHKSLIHLVVFLANFRIVASGKWILFVIVAIACGTFSYLQKNNVYNDITPQTGQFLYCKTKLSAKKINPLKVKKIKIIGKGVSTKDLFSKIFKIII